VNFAALFFAADTLENLVGRIRSRLQDAVESANRFCNAVAAAPLSDASVPAILQVSALLRTAFDDDKGLSGLLSDFDVGALRIAHARLLAHLVRSRPPSSATPSRCPPPPACTPPAPVPGHSSHIIMVPPVRRTWLAPGGRPAIVSARPSLPDEPVEPRYSTYSRQVGYSAVDPDPRVQPSPSIAALCATTPLATPSHSPPAVAASAPRCDECRGCFACATLLVESGCDRTGGPDDRVSILYNRVVALEEFSRKYASTDTSSSGSSSSDSSSSSSTSEGRRRKRRYVKRQAVSLQDRETQTEAAAALPSCCGAATVLGSFRHDSPCLGSSTGCSPVPSEVREEFSSGFASHVDEDSDSSAVTIVPSPLTPADRRPVGHSWPAILLFFLTFVLSSFQEVLSGLIEGLSAALGDFPSAAAKPSRPRVLHAVRPRGRLKSRRVPIVIVRR